MNWVSSSFDFYFAAISVAKIKKCHQQRCGQNIYSVLKVIKLAIMIFAVIHFNGCILFMVPMFMDFPGMSDHKGLFMTVK